VYRCWQYGGDAVISCIRRLVQCWLCKRFQPTVRYRYMGKYMQSPSVMSPNNLGRALYPPCIRAGISFERNACPRSVHKYQIDFTQRCIRRFRKSQLWTAIPRSNWRGVGTQRLLTHARIWSECTHWQYIYWTPEWAVVLPSTISQPYICWASWTWLQGRIYECQPRGHVWSS